MTNKLLQKGIPFLTFIILLSGSLSAQVFRKIHSDGEAVKCVSVEDNIFTFTVEYHLSNLNFFSNSLAFETTKGQYYTENTGSITNLPCDLHVGFYIPELGTNFYQPVQASDFYDSFTYEQAVIHEGTSTITFNGDDYEFECNGHESLTLILDLYCMDENGNFSAVNACAPEFEEIIYMPYFNLRNCSAQRTFEVELCCDENNIVREDPQIDNRSKTQEFEEIEITVNLFENKILFNGFSKDENVSLKIYNLSGQLIDQQTYTTDAEKLASYNFFHLNSGYYIVNISTKNRYLTTRFVKP